jgi:hypothetical protein
MPFIQQYNIIFVMSGGKTGSKTLVHSFAKMHDTVRHSHSAEPVIIAVKRGWRILIVNSFRETISRHISSLFHNLRRDHVPDIDLNLPHETNYPRVEARMNRYAVESDFFESYHPLTDFFEYFKLEYKFDKSNKWVFHPRILPNVDLLMLRFDQLTNWEQQIRKVFPYFKMVPSNLSAQKRYYSLFTYFKQLYPVNTTDFKRLFENERPLLEQYFTPDEVMILYNKYFP